MAMDLDAALEHIRAAPRDRGVIELLVRRPAPGEREILDEAVFDPERGVLGDRWLAGKNGAPPDPASQVALMPVRAIAALAERERWALAGDQLLVDLDLGEANLPTGTRLAAGTAVLEVTAKPHHGCDKFTARFGSEATRWVNSPAGRELRLRGIHARIVVAGAVRRGDSIYKLS